MGIVRPRKDVDLEFVRMAYAGYRNARTRILVLHVAVVAATISLIWLVL